jgi:hypothetical protein
VVLFWKEVDINEFHKILGHCGSDILEKTAKIHDFKVNGEFKTCEQFVITKSRHKNVNKDWKGVVHDPVERLYSDISSI